MATPCQRRSTPDPLRAIVQPEKPGASRAETTRNKRSRKCLPGLDQPCCVLVTRRVRTRSSAFDHIWFQKSRTGELECYKWSKMPTERHASYALHCRFQGCKSIDAFSCSAIESQESSCRAATSKAQCASSSYGRPQLLASSGDTVRRQMQISFAAPIQGKVL